MVPGHFYALTAALNGRNCANCGAVPQEPALCLVCGAVICAARHCARHKPEAGARGEGDCTRHARTCGGGCGIFYLVHQCTVLLLHSAFAAYHPSLYLDAHGEEDRGLRRGKPLFLNPERRRALYQLWLAHAVPVEVVRSRAASSSVIVLNYW